MSGFASSQVKYITYLHQYAWADLKLQRNLSTNKEVKS
jgi:hypothetical protein